MSIIESSFLLLCLLLRRSKAVRGVLIKNEQAACFIHSACHNNSIIILKTNFSLLLIRIALALKDHIVVVILVKNLDLRAFDGGDAGLGVSSHV